MPREIVGYFDLSGKAPRGFRDKKVLTKLPDALDAFEKWKGTLLNLIAFLKGQLELPAIGRIPLDIFNLGRNDALDWVEYFIRHDEAEVRTGGLQLAPQSPHGDSNAKNGVLWSDDLAERLWDVRLFSKKKRKRGIFIPGARRSKNRDAQFMRLRIPHK